MKRIYLFFMLMLFSGFLFAQQNILFFGENNPKDIEPKRVVNTTKGNSIEVEYQFSGAWQNKMEAKNLNFDILQIKGFGLSGEIGKPAVPMRSDIIAIPQENNVKIIIEQADYKEFSNFMLYPVQEPPRDTEGAPLPPFEMNEESYKINDFYPSEIVKITDIQKLRGTPLAFVQLSPVQFNPVTKTIRVYSKIKYRIEYLGKTDAQKNVSTKHFSKIMKNYVVNPEMIAEGESIKESKSGRSDYIIVTHSDFIDAANSLASWKRKLGYSVEVISQSSWTTTQVKEAIHSRYASWTPKPDYFVIIGDHDQVPGEIFRDPDDEDDFASDLYYACMDGEDDYVPDMAKGRISVSTATQANTVINKIINYEQNPVADADFYQNGLNCAQFQDKVNDSDTPDGIAARRFAQTSEEIRNYVVGQNYTVNRVYYTDAANTPTNWNNNYYGNGEDIPAELLKPAFAWDGDQTDIANEINDGKFYVFHRDHGYVGGSGWAHPYFTKTQVNNLTNGDKLPVVFSINCHTGEFKLPECFAETFLRKSGGGAVGIFAASFYSYSGYNDAFSVGMIDAIWSNPGLLPTFGTAGVSNPNLSNHGDIYTMGNVLNQGLIRMLETFAWSSGRVYTHRLFHYFGDPAMQMWTAQPNAITANIPTSITCDATSLTVNNISATSGIVSLCHNNKLIAKAAISNGSATLNFIQIGTSTKKATITISGHNYIPKTTEATITGTCNLAPVADFNSDKTSVMANESVNFTDASVYSPTSWQWTFEGGNPASSTDQNPQNIVYENEGTYKVTLVATNSEGTNTKTKENYITVTPFVLTYCTVSSSSSSYEYISNITVGSINNNSFGTKYSDYTNITTEMQQGESYPISIKNVNHFNADKIGCWIDWDIDGTFEPGEKTEITYAEDKSTGTGIGTIIVPNEAIIGTARMRVLITDGATVNPCGEFEYGEVEDYGIIVTSAVQTPEIAVSQNETNIALNSEFTYSTEVTVGQNQEITFDIANSGNADLTSGNITLGSNEFTVSQEPTTTVAAAGNGTFKITFTPTAAGEKSTTVSFSTNDSDENPFVFTLKATAVATPIPEIAVSQNETNIALNSEYTYATNVTVGQSQEITFDIANSGNADLTSGSITLGSNEFSVSQEPTTTVAAAGNGTFKINFTPTSEGEKSTTVSFSTNDSDENPFVFTLKTTAVSVQTSEIAVSQNETNIALNSEYTYATNVTIGQNQEITFDIANSGNADLTSGNITLGSDEFSVSQEPTTTVAVAGNGTFKINFTPTSEGEKSTTISFSTSDSDENPFVFILKATAISNSSISDFSAKISVNPNPVNDICTVELPKDEGKVFVQIFDMKGKIIFSKKIKTENNKAEVSFAKFATGFYLMKISTKETTYQTKIMKK